MSRHLADHRKPSQGGRMKHFLQIARGAASGEIWHKLWQRPAERGESNRRVAEYVRIDKGREV